MKRLAAALRGAFEATRSWLKVPFNAVLAALGLTLCVSLLSLAFGDRLQGTVLYFPAGGSSVGPGPLRGEYRDLPVIRGLLPPQTRSEARAALIAEELLLGPVDPRLHPAFPAGTRLGQVLLRSGNLLVDLGEEAALLPAAELEAGIAALKRSIRKSLPLIRKVTVTIGGREPWADWPATASSGPDGPPGGPKSVEKN